jgi:hypothetical protein
VRPALGEHQRREGAAEREQAAAGAVAAIQRERADHRRDDERGRHPHQAQLV